MTPIALAVRSGNAPADQPPRVFTQEFTVGRHPSSGIVVENSSIVSGTHLRIVPTPQGNVKKCNGCKGRAEVFCEEICPRD